MKSLMLKLELWMDTVGENSGNEQFTLIYYKIYTIPCHYFTPHANYLQP